MESEKTFHEVSAQYLHEYDIMTQGQRNRRDVDGQPWRSSVHLVPFFGKLGISEITAGKIGIPNSQIQAWRLEFRDVTIVVDEDWGKTILEIEVRGKRGVGYCKSMPGAVRPFERLRIRLRPARVYGVNTPTDTSVNSDAPGEQWRTPDPTDLIFPKGQQELFKTILDEQKLRFDREGRPRTAYGLRHPYLCLRLMEGADIYQIAKNCRTSVEMIEKYYAAHIRTSLDSVAINVMRPRKNKKGKKVTQNTPVSPQPVDDETGM